MRSLSAIGLVFAVVSCGPAPPTEPPAPPPQDLVVLLRDQEGGMVGSVSVTNASGSVVLDAEGETSEIAPGQPPVQGTTLSTAEVAASFGDVLSGLPPTPARFTLYFEFNSDQLTDASEALIPEILQTLSARPADTILLVGHTDTTGDAETNFRTGLSRATRVQELLADAGVTAGSVDVISLGENDLLVETPDETAEPRNRRVEIILP